MRSLVRFQLAPHEDRSQGRARPRHRCPRRRRAATAWQRGSATPRRRLARAFGSGLAIVRAVLVGAGAVGLRAARQLFSLTTVETLGVVDIDASARDAGVASLGGPARPQVGDSLELGDGDVLLLAAPCAQRQLAERALDEGAHVVSTSDATDDVKALLALDAE